MSQIPALTEADFEEAIRGPRLMVLALDAGEGVATLLDELLALNADADADLARLTMPAHAMLVARRLPGRTGERVVLIRSGVVLADFRRDDLTANVLRDQLEFAVDADPVAVARRALGGFAADWPRDARAFAGGFAGVYVFSLLSHWRIIVHARGECRHEDSQSGVQGSTTETRTGTWRDLGDGRIELLWTREDFDVEVGMARDRSSVQIRRAERIRPRWVDGVVVEFRPDGDALPGSRPPAHTYMRQP